MKNIVITDDIKYSRAEPAEVSHAAAACRHGSVALCTSI